MSNNRPLIIGLAVVAVVITIIVVVLLINSSNSPGTASANASPNPAQDENTLRTQVYGEMTSTAVIVAATNQQATLAALQSTVAAQSAFLLTPQQQVIVVQPTQQTVFATAAPNSNPVAPAREYCQQVLAESNLPNGSTYELVVEPNTFVVWKAGQNLCVDYGGQRVDCYLNNSVRGIMAVFLPVDNQTTIYQLSSLFQNMNYHAVYASCSDEEQATWVDHEAEGIAGPPNCASGQGCTEVEVVTVQGSQANDDIR